MPKPHKCSLEAQNNYMKYMAYHQNERLGLIGTLGALQMSSAQASSMQRQGALLDGLVKDYVTGVKPSGSSNSSSSAASS